MIWNFAKGHSMHGTHKSWHWESSEQWKLKNKLEQTASNQKVLEHEMHESKQWCILLRWVQFTFRRVNTAPQIQIVFQIEVIFQSHNLNRVIQNMGMIAWSPSLACKRALWQHLHKSVFRSGLWMQSYWKKCQKGGLPARRGAGKVYRARYQECIV